MKTPNTLICYRFNLLFFAIFILLSCNNGQSNTNKGDSADTVNTTSQKTPDISKVRQFEGKWVAERDNWSVTITKVTGNIYDVQFQNSNMQDIAKGSSGSFELSADYKFITKGEKNSKYYQSITISDDGRLYTSGGYFYTRQ